MPTPQLPDAGGADDALSVHPTVLPQDQAGAADALSTGITVPLTAGDAAGADDRIQVVKYLLPPVPNQSGLAVLSTNPYFAGGSLAGWTAVNGSQAAAQATLPGAFYQFGFNNPAGVATWNITANFGAEVINNGDTAIVQVAAASPCITGVSDTAGNTYVKIAMARNQAGTMYQYVFAAYGCQPMGSADHVTVTASATGNYMSSAYGATSYLGRLAQAPVTGYGQGPNASQIISAGAGDTLIAIPFSPGAGGSVPSGWTSGGGNSGNGFNNTVLYQAATAGGLTTPVSAGFSGNWGMILLDFVPANANAATPGAAGAWAFQYTNNGTTAGGIFASSRIPLVSGIGYLVTCWVNSSVSSVQAGFDWYNASGTYVSTTVQTFGVPVGTWVQLAFAVPGGSAIPATATSMVPRVGSATLSAVIQAYAILVTAQQPTALPVASPAFIKSQMPRMHVQNLLTGQWYHRDVQGITQPSITWNLNNPDTFSCTLAPPRRDMLDATGNPAFGVEWRDAVYLEENDSIVFGGIVTESQFNGPAWALTATGFAGYATGMPYEGSNLTSYGMDALDAVRYLWNWLQSQPGGNLGLKLDTAESGVQVGGSITNLASSQLARNAAAGQPDIWLWNAAAFQNGERITINSIAYTIKTVVTDTSSVATGEVTLSGNLAEAHSAGEEVLEVQTYSTLARAAASGQPNIWLWDAAGFSNSQVILIGTVPYTISTVVTNTAGVATGEITLSATLGENHAAGEQVVLAPTPFQLLWYNSTDCGQEIASIQQEAVFDWHEQHAWTSAAKTGVNHYLHFGVPRVGSRRSDLRFAEGENVIQPVQITRDGSTFADHVWGLGAGSGNSQIRSDAAALSGQRLTRSFVYTDQTVTTVARMSSKVQKVLAAMSNIDTPGQMVIKNHPNAPFGSFMCGDDIPVLLASGWRSGVIWCRITAMSQDPTTDIMTMTLARSDSFTYIAQSGQAGTI